ncbi:MAG: BACON domain-containing protein, partial [Bacteroidales bacterium]|nr:BACON domain-containing protein [Bacteroidales bacterium]
IDALETVGKDGRTETRYVSGIISQVISYNSDYNSITYSITADGQPSSAYIQVYSGKGLNGANFSSINDLSVGDEVIVAGSLMKYQSGSDIIPEIYQNSQIVSLVKAPYFTATASPQTFESEGGNATLSVEANVPWTATINNGGSLKIGDANASTSVSGTNDTEVTVIIPENAEGATYTISFTTTSDKVTAPDPIQIIQNAYVDLVEATATFTGKKSGGMTGTQTQQTGVRRNVTAVISNGLADETSDHIRVYKNETLTLSVPDGAYITAIEFTGSSSSYPVSGFADKSGFTKSENSGIWSGSSQSVVFTASGSQVRLDRIDVTYHIAEEELITYVPVINVTSANPMSVENSAGSQTITYAIDEAPDGATLTGVTKNEGANWISNIVYSTSGTVTFDVAAQETGAQARSATLTLKYTGATDVPVTVNQAAGPSLGDLTSTLTFTAKCNGSGTADDGVTWTVTSDGTESNFESDRGIHYGTNNASVQYIKLSTSGISGTITKVVVNASAASQATVDVKVGGSAFGGNPKSLSSSAANYTFEGSASGEIVVTVTKPEAAKKALYVKSIAVTYNNN